MWEWTVKLSITKRNGDRISCEMFEAEIFADDEDEVRKIVAENEPDAAIDGITKGEYLGD